MRIFGRTRPRLSRRAREANLMQSVEDQLHDELDGLAEARATVEHWRVRGNALRLAHYGVPMTKDQQAAMMNHDLIEDARGLR